ncbi:hypothetical protein [Sinorhizobium sp. BJ1]|uniref:hypothetical protein n=1 Tax=Sinorhizobium sp. BJ1 TaxID=2035455 RepID=UPI0015CF1CBD|nr:hypothetical protein [Sinorhizobium sp. BJ1]
MRTAVADTYITIQARLALWLIIAVGAALLGAGTAYQAYALDKQWERDARV